MIIEKRKNSPQIDHFQFISLWMFAGGILAFLTIMSYMGIRLASGAAVLASLDPITINSAFQIALALGIWGLLAQALQAISYRKYFRRSFSRKNPIATTCLCSLVAFVILISFPLISRWWGIIVFFVCFIIFQSINLSFFFSKTWIWTISQIAVVIFLGFVLMVNELTYDLAWICTLECWYMEIYIGTGFRASVFVILGNLVLFALSALTMLYLINNHSNNLTDNEYAQE